MISDVCAELRTINRRVGCLIVLFVVFAIIALVAAIFLFDKASHSLLDQVQVPRDFSRAGRAMPHGQAEPNRRNRQCE